MPTFNPKIYFDGAPKRVFIELFDDAQPVDINECMPPESTVGRFDQEAFELFWHVRFPLWLVDDRYSKQAKGGTKDNPVFVRWADHIDLTHLGLVADDQLNETRLLIFIRLIAEFWRYQPMPGLLHSLCRANTTETTIRTALSTLADPQRLVFDMTRLDALDLKARELLVSTINTSRRFRRMQKRKR